MPKSVSAYWPANGPSAVAACAALSTLWMPCAKS
jgi:hypothetical protein